MEENNQHPVDTLKDIRQMMERSSRFISLSGLSGIAAGVCALVGAWIAYGMLDTPEGRVHLTRQFSIEAMDWLSIKLICLALATFVAALGSAFYLTWRKARKQQLPIWDYTSRRLFWNMVLPMVAGGLFIIGMLQYGEWRFVAPCCLIFYGLALVNASKYTLSDIRYLGYCEIVLGLISMQFIGYGLYFWAAGFGMLHIFYGTMMWWKYERNEG